MRVFLPFAKENENENGAEGENTTIGLGESQVSESSVLLSKVDEEIVEGAPSFPTRNIPPQGKSSPPSAPETQVDSQKLATKKTEKPATAGQARLKTTGLDTPPQDSKTASRKRKSPDPISSLVSKPKARELIERKKVPFKSQPQDDLTSNTMVSSGSPRRLHGGQPSSSGNEPRWRYQYHGDDDVRQDAEGPVEEVSPHMMFAENNPESARGDPVVSTSTAEFLPPVASALSVPEQEFVRRCPPTAALKSALSEYADFAATLKKRGLEIQEQAGDGNCLFRAVSLQVYGDPSMHADIRKKCMDFMERDKDHFAPWITDEPISQYIARKRMNGVHGDNAELQAISELFNRPIEVFTPETGSNPLNIFHSEYKTDDAPIRLAYHDGNHYNAVIDPLVPTAGLGLGLPGLQPGLADKMQMAKAVAESDAAADIQRAMKQSEEDEIQRNLKESEDDDLQRAIKMSRMSSDSVFSDQATTLSDMDATYEQLEQAALEESLRHLEHGQKKKALEHPSKPASSSNAAASLPSSLSTSEYARAPVAASAAAASISAAASLPSAPSPLRPAEDYSQAVQDLVMNGFQLKDVVKAYDLVGDNFDAMLTFLLSKTSS